MSYNGRAEQPKGNAEYSEVFGSDRIQVFSDSRCKWCEEERLGWRCYFKGWFFYGKSLFKDDAAAGKIIDLLKSELSPDQTGKVLNSLNGNFAFIMRGHGRIVAGVDKIRSYPIFYSTGATGFVVSNSARMVHKEMGLTNLDHYALIEFQMAGYVTGQDTLISGLKQLQAGECLYYETYKLELKCFRYYGFYLPLKAEQTNEKWIDELEQTTKETFHDLINILDGRAVWVPLSGGLDSRLVLSTLKQLGYDRIVSFSYGRPHNWEAKIAKQVAAKIGVRWLFVPFTRRNVSYLYETKECKTYLRYADGLCSVPFLSDFYAILQLRKSGAIPKDAVVINGQSGDFITGGHLPLSISDQCKSWSDLIEKTILGKHYSLWSDLKTEENLQFVSRRLKDRFWVDEEPEDRQKAADLIECWEWQERQSKFVVNGQRMYDFFDFEWTLPLWSEQYLRFWAKVPWQLKMGQQLYKRYLRKVDPYGLFSWKWPVRYATPRYVSLLSSPFLFLERVFRKERAGFFKTHLNYLLDSGPLYSFLSCKEFLKRSSYHRNVISYRVYETLKHVTAD